jgi:hypothetical protein
VPRLAILPGMLALVSALGHGRWLTALPFAVLIASLVIAYGAVITSLGLALATWQPRPGRAVGLSVAAFLAVAVFYPTIAIMTMRLGPDDMVFLWVSPFFGMLIPMDLDSHYRHMSTSLYAVIPVWIALTSAAAYALLLVTIASFDRLLGRMPVVAEPVTDRRTDIGLALRYEARQVRQGPA